MKRKGKIRAGIVALLVIAAGVVAWNVWFSATRIAFVNYQVITLGQIAKANDQARIRLSVLDTEELDDIGKYDLVLINGMGLRITAEQRAAIQRAADNGLAVITTMATDPANAIVSADSATVATVKGYLNGGGRRNYRNMLVFIRRTVDGKTFDSDEPDAPVEREQKQFYHIDPDNPEDEETDFGSVAEYDAFLRKHGLWSEDAPHLIVTGQMGEPESWSPRWNGRAIGSIASATCRLLYGAVRLTRYARPAVINMAHGRMGDDMVNYLTKRDIPLFAPLNVNRLVDEWEADKMGMNGGFLSQSVVMPEIDGAIRPYALFGHRLDAEGLQQAYAMPERLATFVETVNNHVALRSKPNSEKRVAIYYYKGPGQNALTAAGMEVAPSLYNLLVRMKREGYRIEHLPASAAELERLIQRQGAVFNAYAGGAKADFLKNGNPELISAEQYTAWTAAATVPNGWRRSLRSTASSPAPILRPKTVDWHCPVWIWAMSCCCRNWRRVRATTISPSYTARTPHRRMPM